MEDAFQDGALGGCRRGLSPPPTCGISTAPSHSRGWGPRATPKETEVGAEAQKRTRPVLWAFSTACWSVPDPASGRGLHPASRWPEFRRVLGRAFRPATLEAFLLPSPGSGLCSAGDAWCVVASLSSVAACLSLSDSPQGWTHWSTAATPAWQWPGQGARAMAGWAWWSSPLPSGPPWAVVACSPCLPPPGPPSPSPRLPLLLPRRHILGTPASLSV